MDALLRGRQVSAQPGRRGSQHEVVGGVQTCVRLHPVPSVPQLPRRAPAAPRCATSRRPSRARSQRRSAHPASSPRPPPPAPAARQRSTARVRLDVPVQARLARRRCASQPVGRQLQHALLLSQSASGARRAHLGTLQVVPRDAHHVAHLLGGEEGGEDDLGQWGREGGNQGGAVGSAAGTSNTTQVRRQQVLPRAAGSPPVRRRRRPPRRLTRRGSSQLSTLAMGSLAA